MESNATIVLPAHDLSFVSLILHADPIVQAVMAVLVLASLACWSIVIDRVFGMRAAGREAAAFRREAGQGERASGPVAQAVWQAGVAAWRDDDSTESRIERRDRIERAMRLALSERLRGLQRGVGLLATTGSAAPFIGLFGTVWGIMNAFSAIAKSQDTSLSVVAPGIAEALFATAVGLVAAIPAVIAYNKLTGDAARVRQIYAAGIAVLGDRLARRPPSRGQEAAE